MTFALTPGKLGFKLGEVLVGLQSGTTDTPETIDSTQHALHTLSYLWNADTLSYEVATAGGTGSGTDVFVTNQATDEATKIDVSASPIIYIGSAPAGVSGGSAGWKVQRITTSSGGAVIEWADGNILYDNVWDNRASLTYS
jgi:hypothetical protein